MPLRSLQEEIGKQRPFDALEQEAYLNLLRTAYAFESEFDRFFKEHGLSHATFNALRILRGHGPAGAPSQTIGKELITPVPDVTRLVDRLVDCKLVERSRVDRDRRVVMVKITKAGLDLLAKLDLPVLDLHRRQFKHMSPQDIAEFNRLSFLARQRPDKTGDAPD